MGTPQMERTAEVLPGMCEVPLVQRQCVYKERGDVSLEHSKELHIEALVEEELDRIVEEHGMFASDHEAWAVIREEVQEANEEIFAVREAMHEFWSRIRADYNDTDNIDVMNAIEMHGIELIKEAVQVVACARKWKQGHIKDWVESKAVRA